MTTTDAAPLSDRARSLHQRSIVFDAHMDSLQRIVIEGVDLGQKTDGQADLVRWKEGGVRAQVFAVWVDTIYVPHHAARRAFQQIDAFHTLLEQYPDRIALARTASDVRRIVAGGKLAALLAIEGGAAIQGDLALLRTFQRLGALSMTLTHSATTTWADSSTDASRWNGLSPFGRDVIREMNRLRMLVDVSHVSDACVRDVLATSTAPIIASHSCCKAICDHPRNLTDDLLRAIAAAGGVIGMNFFAGFVDQEYNRELSAIVDVLGRLNEPRSYEPDELDAAAAERLRTFFNWTLPRPAFDRLIDHVDHAVEVAGIDHVGLGSDLDSGILPTPLGLDSVSDFPRVTEALLARGYRDEDIEKILGGNFLRVLDVVAGS